MAPIDEDTIICTTCGTEILIQTTLAEQRCKICEDPRQYLPASGQKWSTWSDLEKHDNVIKPLPRASSIWTIHTEPKFGIGQRCFLISTPKGNVLWDCITLLDAPTISFINAKGGLEAIVISHPHYYTTHLRWARAFDCPVYIAAEDEQWCTMPDGDHYRQKIIDMVTVQEIVKGSGIQALKLGGHFPGSLVLRYQPGAIEDALLFIADTIKVSPSGLSPDPRPPGMSSFNFMWSYPNAIPLSPHTLHEMWEVLESFKFSSTHGAFANEDIWSKDVKKRMLESMQIQARYMGWTAANAKILRISS